MSVLDPAPPLLTIQSPGVVRHDASEEPVAGDRAGEPSAPDIVEVWGLGSFPASDPPSNW